ncbi:MAG: 50S ribosomal protein L13 [Spirochaetes bacterium GWD1_27_9]|nr:MAG: 50S ribosomal protein L13 [Spirochaetes bacterium GWC1_27_15]OHD42782.1 MAG: 50S ribosomal protein L13 [Spirochaetes bacterium GWD1_27_9]
MKKYDVYNVTPKDVKKKWCIIDANGKPLGKVAAKAAYILRGKHKAIYTPYLDTGDNVVIINAAKALMTGNKFKDKIYYNYSGHPGGMKSITYEKLVAKKPTDPLEIAIKGMLPKGPLGRDLFRNLRVYEGENYDALPQKPEVIEKL